MPELKLGAVLVFNESMTKAQVERLLLKIKHALSEEYGDNLPHVHEFDPRWGYPTFYIP